jgi:hypothetical protein
MLVLSFPRLFLVDMLTIAKVNSETFVSAAKCANSVVAKYLTAKGIAVNQAC